MPFSKHVVDPAQIEAMRSAFQKVCNALDLKCDPDDRLTEIIAIKSSNSQRLVRSIPVAFAPEFWQGSPSDGQFYKECAHRRNGVACGRRGQFCTD
jgi:hypothetical protein